MILGDEGRAGEGAYPASFARFAGVQTIGGTPVAGDARISSSFKKMGHKGTIKIKKGALGGIKLGNSKSQ